MSVNTIKNLSAFETAAKNTVLKNTYILLSLTLLFSGASAYISAIYKLPHPGLLGIMVVPYLLLFLIQANKNRVTGIFFVFILTGFMGYSLGPLMDSLSSTARGINVLTISISMTAVLFLSLSGYVITTNRNYNYLGGLIFIGSMTAFVSMLCGYIFKLPIITVAASAAFSLISSAMILYHTSEIINSGEKNYIVATVSLYISIYNLLVSLIHIFMSLSSNRN